jgi:hypothetical protein
MTSDEFMNACNIMRSLDFHDLFDETAALPATTFFNQFANNPIAVFTRADDETRAMIWKAVERRMGKRT